MPTALLERVASAKLARDKAQAAFVEAMTDAKQHHSWTEIGEFADLTPTGVRYQVANLNGRRQKGEK